MNQSTAFEYHIEFTTTTILASKLGTVKNKIQSQDLQIKIATFSPLDQTCTY